MIKRCTQVQSMTKTRYNADALEHMFVVELDMLKYLLAHVIGDFNNCSRRFREKGFSADEPYNALLEASGQEEIGRHCLAQLGGQNPERVSLADLIELYPNRML